MSLLFAAALATAATAGPTLPSCSWDRPGANPFMGDVVAAVDRYTDIPVAVREKLKARVAARRYDEMAAIRRDSITGKARYRSEIRDMHFGNGQVCRTVTRQRWSDSTVERGLVYCESGHCLIVPTVCRNVSRITRLPGEAVAANSEGQEADAAALASAGSGASDDGGSARALQVAQLVPDATPGSLPGDGEIRFEAPGAGPSFADAAAAPGGGEPALPDAGSPGEASGGPLGGGAPITSPGAAPGAAPGGGFGSGPGFADLAAPEGERSSIPGRVPLASGGGGGTGGGSVPLPLSPAPPFGGGGGGVFTPPGGGTVLPPAPLPAVPEPGTLWLGLGGALLLAWRLRRRQA